MNIENSEYYRFSTYGDLDSIALNLLRLSNNEFISRAALRDLKDMSGRNYQSYDDEEDLLTPDTPIEVLEATSITKSVSNYCNNKMVPLDYIKTMLILLMNKGFLVDHYRMLELRDDLYAYNDVKIKDIINNFYDTENKKLSDIFDELCARYPIINTELKKSLSYFIKENPNADWKIQKDTSTIDKYLRNHFEEDDIKIIDEYVDKMRTLRQSIILPTLSVLVNLFKYDLKSYRNQQSNALKIFDSFISVKDYNKILANKYLMETSHE